MSGEVFWMPFLAGVPFGIWLIVAILASFAFGTWLAISGWPMVVDHRGNKRRAEWPPWAALFGITFWPVPVFMAVVVVACVVLTSPAWAPMALVFGIKSLVNRRKSKSLIDGDA